jgi:ferric iron reductase protein FhuF
VSLTLPDVLDAVQGRVDYLRASTELSPEGGWYDCDAIGVADLDASIDVAVAESPEEVRDRQVSASLLVQSYAHRIAAVSLAAYAVGLPWPSPAAAATSVRLAGHRARALRFRTAGLGDPDDVSGLVEQLFPGHLSSFVTVVRGSERLGERLLWANVAASFAAAFRAVEGAARDRGDSSERADVRRRADDLFRHASPLDGTGGFDAESDDWAWQRSACCLWYRTSGGRMCEGCSLRREPR